MTNSDSEKHLPAVTMLRGLASLGVCLMHVSGTVKSDFLNEIGRFGGFGVPVFFVISGFIIPYSMYRSAYVIRDYPRFLLRRFIRIDPPYFLTIAGIFLLSVLARFSSFRVAPGIDFWSPNTLYHFFYLVDFFDGNWLSPVFWTLAIEFQFYLFAGLIFPLLLMKKAGIQIVVLALLAGLPFVLSDDRLLSAYILFFISGISLFLFMTGQIKMPLFIAVGIAVLILSYFKSGIPGVLCPLFSCCFIFFVKKSLKPLLFLGTISFSLYLVHTPVGTDGLINYLQNYILSENGRIILMLCSLPVIIFCAWLFYLMIEKPSMKLAKRISYRKNK